MQNQINIPIVEINNMYFRYGSTDVLKDISLRMYEGDYVGLVGHNGSGKTTLIKLILGLIKPRSGHVRLFGESIDAFRLWEKIGYMPQNLSLSNQLFPATVEEVVCLGLLSEKKFPKRIDRVDKQRVVSVLEQLRIDHLKNRLVGDLSGGQQQRVFLAKALVSNPRLLILDEPSSALDAATRNEFFSILKELNTDKKVTIILITHDMGQVGEYANKLLYLDQKIVFFGSFRDFCISKNMSKQFGIDTQHIICHQH